MDPLAPIVAIDGEIVAPERATISVLDRGLLYGDGCFEVLRTWSGVAVELEAHLDRLIETATFLRLAGVERTWIRSTVDAVIEAAHAATTGELRIRIVLTRGSGGLGTPVATLGPGRMIVIVEPLGALPSELSVAIVDWPVPRRPGRGHKLLAYLDHVLARELARSAGADEALRLDETGHVVEGATCNVFCVSGGVVITPATRGVLPGIVRGRVLALCREAAIESRVGALTPDALRGADEVFVTSSLRGILPVTRLDGANRPRGPVAAQLAASYTTEMHALGTSAPTGRPRREG